MNADIGAGYNTVTIVIWGDQVNPARDDHTQTIRDIIATNPHATITIRTHPDHTPSLVERLTVFNETHELLVTASANHATCTLSSAPVADEVTR